MGNKQEKLYPIQLSEDLITHIMSITSFKRDEIVQWHEGFIKDCPKGRLDKNQFIDVYKVLYPQGKAHKFCNHVFKVFGSGGGQFGGMLNSYINFTEFLTAISLTATGDAQKKLKIAFNMYDYDKNGQLDKKEMEKIIEALYDMIGEENRSGENSPAERVKQIMNKLDTDNNGYLTENEFVEGCLEDNILKFLLAPDA